jgi:hypothetical protein
VALNTITPTLPNISLKPINTDADSDAKQLPKILENYYNFDSIILIKTR